MPSTACAQGPSPASASSQRMMALQQQNAFLQQQNAVQNALQQTTILTQNAYMQFGTPLPVGTPSTINFQQQQVALQLAVQQTAALLQTSSPSNSGLGQMARRQLNTLQATLQQSFALQTAKQMQGGLLTTDQLLMLSQEQTSMSSLLTAQPPVSPRRTPTK